MTVKRTKGKVEELEVEAVGNPERVEELTGELQYTVKLDSKKFESRTLDQAFMLVKGSEGVVSKITIERQ